MLQRYRNSVKNAKGRPSQKEQRVPKWIREALMSPNEKEKFKKSLDSQVSECTEYVDGEVSQWKKLQSCIAKVAREILRETAVDS